MGLGPAVAQVGAAEQGPAVAQVGAAELGAVAELRPELGQAGPEQKQDRSKSRTGIGE